MLPSDPARLISASVSDLHFLHRNSNNGMRAVLNHFTSCEHGWHEPNSIGQVYHRSRNERRVISDTSGFEHLFASKLLDIRACCQLRGGRCAQQVDACFERTLCRVPMSDNIQNATKRSAPLQAAQKASCRLLKKIRRRGARTIDPYGTVASVPYYSTLQRGD